MTDSENQLFNDIMTKFDADWCAGEEMRTEASNDIYFALVSQWDDWLGQFTTLQYRGQFDVVKPIVRKLVAEMRQNPIQVKYKPIDTAGPDAAETLMGMYRTDMRSNAAKIAVDVAAREQIICGTAAWRLCTKHVDENPTSNDQVIVREVIHEAYNHVIWDSNARMIDKSDAMHVTVIMPMTTAGWDEFAEKEDLDADNVPTFNNPDSQWYFPWLSRDVVYVGEHYKITEKKEKVFIYIDPVTQEPVSYFKRDIADVIDELADQGFEKVGERMIKRKRVVKYLITGDRILKGPIDIAGEHLPVVPVMGDWGYAGDKEVFEGIVRGTKDMQRARNMVMSFNMDIVGRSPRSKPIFYPEQIQGYERFYDGNDDFPYYLMNRTTPSNVALPAQPVAYLQDAQIPPGNQLVYDAMTQAISDVASSGADASAAQGGNPAAFDTVNQINQRADMETYVFLDNMATAMRRDGEIYAAMAAEIYDTPRTVTITGEDGKEQEVKLFEVIFDLKTGEQVVLNDVSGRYQTYVDVGPSFKSMKDASRAEIKELLSVIDPNSAEWKMLFFQYLTLWDGPAGDMMREYANKQLLLMGLKKPETPEEQQIVMQAQQAQGQQQDPNMIAAQAQLGLAQAENKKADNETAQVKIKAFTAQQQAQQTQADTVLKLAQAQNINDKAVLDGMKLLSEVSSQQAEQIPGIMPS